MSDTISPMNVSKALAQVKERIAQASAGYVGAPLTSRTLENFRVMCDTALGDLKETGRVADAKLGWAAYVRETWKDVYPSPWKRMVARSIAYALRKGWLQTEDERWYHHVLPFTIDRSVSNSVDWELAAGMDAEELRRTVEQNTYVFTSISLRTPQTYIRASITIRPPTPAEYVKMTLTV